MSFPVTTAAIALPTYGEPYVLVNDGTDVVYVGVRRDTLTADGFPLQPLAQLTLDGVQTFYAQANSGTQALDMLPGGTGFAPSPGQIAAQIVTSTLASAIASAILQTGVRQVDQPTVLLGTVPPFLSTSYSTVTFNLAQTLDVRGYQSWTIDASFPTGSTAQNAVLLIQWLTDPASGIVLASKTYELPQAIGAFSVSDQHYGPYMIVNVKSLSGAPSTAGCGLNLMLSNRPAARESFGGAGDGVLLDLPNQAGLGAGADTQHYECLTVPGFATISASLGGTPTNTSYVAWLMGGAGGHQQRIANWDANGYIETTIVLPRRPLYIWLHNGTAAAQTYRMNVTVNTGD